MTVPGWVDPDPDPREEPDDGGGQALVDPAEAPRPAASGLDELAEKPVLEWTNEDWALWIDSADTRPLPTSPAPGDAPESVPAADIGPSEPPEPAADTEPGEMPVDQGPEPEEPAETGERVIPAAAVETTPGDGGSTAGQPSGEFEAAPAEAEVDQAEADDDWAGVADHPWWESAPVVDEVTVLEGDPPTTVEPAPALGSPVEVTSPQPYPSPSVYPSPPAGPATRTTRPMPAPRPAARTDRGVPRPQAPAPAGSHRVRSAFGLLGVAVMVGMVVAGLITVAIFAISLALRHAVG